MTPGCWQRCLLKMGLEADRITRRIYFLAGEEFNLNSPKQLSSVLFEKLELPAPRKAGKAGYRSTGVEILESLSGEHEIAGLILEYRELSKLKNTYLDALPKLVNPLTVESIPPITRWWPQLDGFLPVTRTCRIFP